MLKHLTAAIGAVALALPIANSAAAIDQAAAKKTVVTKKYAGTAVEADRWGTVAVTVTVRTTKVAGSTKVIRRYLELEGSYSYHTSRSQYIMSQSLPQLREEFLAAQSTSIQLVSGATDTSQAFEQSLQSAILKATA